MARTGADDSSASDESKESTERVGIGALNQRLERLRGNSDITSDDTQEQVRNASWQGLQLKEPPNLVAEEQRGTESHTASVETA